jgi:hypothetical protein
MDCSAQRTNHLIFVFWRIAANAADHYVTATAGTF